MKEFIKGFVSAYQEVFGNLEEVGNIVGFSSIVLIGLYILYKYIDKVSK